PAAGRCPPGASPASPAADAGRVRHAVPPSRPRCRPPPPSPSPRSCRQSMLTMRLLSTNVDSCPVRRDARVELSRTGGRDEGVGGEAEQEAGEDAPGGDALGVELAAHREQFDDHVEDGTGGQREERDAQRLVAEALADEGTDKGGTAADQPEQG